MLTSPSPLRTVRETFTSHGSSLHKVSLVGIPANRSSLHVTNWLSA